MESLSGPICDYPKTGCASSVVPPDASLPIFQIRAITVTSETFY
jgi:hypothetical protein